MLYAANCLGMISPLLYSCLRGAESSAAAWMAGQLTPFSCEESGDEETLAISSFSVEARYGYTLRDLSTISTHPHLLPVHLLHRPPVHPRLLGCRLRRQPLDALAALPHSSASGSTCNTPGVCVDPDPSMVEFSLEMTFWQITGRRSCCFD